MICLLIRVVTYHQLRDVSLSMLREQHTRQDTAGASHYYQWLSFHNQMNGAGQELLKEHGKFFEANFLRQVKYAESSYTWLHKRLPKKLQMKKSCTALHSLMQVYWLMSATMSTQFCFTVLSLSQFICMHTIHFISSMSVNKGLACSTTCFFETLAPENLQLCRLQDNGSRPCS